MNKLLYSQLNQKFDGIFISLLFFIVILVATFSYLYKINTNTNNHIENIHAVNKLQLLNKNFNAFIYQDIKFINFDEINKDILDFEKTFKYLKPINSMFDEEIQLRFEAKVNILEYFKSKNALLLNSMHYLFELNKVIKDSKNVDLYTKNILESTFLLMTRYYMNPYIEIESIVNKVNILKLKSKQLNNLELEIFTEHITNNIDTLKSFRTFKTDLKNIKLDKSISKLEFYLEDIYDANQASKKIIVVFLFLLVLFIAIVLWKLQNQSLKLRSDLLGFSTAVENSYNSIVITDAQSNIIYVNDIAVIDSGYTKEELIGQNPRVLKSESKSDAYYKEMYSIISSGKRWEGEFINIKKNGTKYYEKASIMPIFKDNEIEKYLAIKINITDYIKERDKAEYLAYHDSLTALPNRINVEVYLNRLISSSQRKKNNIAVLFIDLDRFKNINDTLGHDVGDELLIGCAKKIKEVLRESDIVARIGGDEFIVVLEQLENEYSLGQVAEKIVEKFQQPVYTKQHTLNITLSIGISIFPDDAKDTKTLFKHADIAMYDAKQKGRNNFQFYKKELSSQVYDRLNLEQQLKHALENDEFYLVYQPQYDLHTRQTVGLEVLIRWENEALGLVPPDKFIPIAEDTGDILDIGKYIFKQACEDFNKCKANCINLQHISINISSVELYQENFIDDILVIVKETMLSTQEIMLEITETHVMKNIDTAMIILKKLRAVGFKISIDDFGTGYSSLNYLKLFPLNELKIDKTFIDELPHGEHDVAISKAIIALSKSMGYINVAEGIETKEQEEFLAGLDCEIGQGYYYSKPLEYKELLEFVNTSS